MRFEIPQHESKEVLREKHFQELWSQVLDKEPGILIECTEEYSKHEFLKWAVKEKGVLLHDSNNATIEKMEPRQAKDTSKEFGNQKSVYAVEDAILPIFYSIRDREKFQGVTQSGVADIDENGETRKDYHFAVTAEVLKNQPWSDGVVYLLPRKSFIQGTDDKGNLIDEWVSMVPVEPIAKLQTTPEDFPYLDEVKPIT